MDMKPVFVSLLLIMAFVAAPTNTRDHRLTPEQCEQFLRETKHQILETCKSLQIEEYRNSTSVYLALELHLLRLCSIFPSGCNHATGVIITFSTIFIFFIIPFFMNYI